MTQNTQFRTAVITDLPAIIGLLADDPLGATREELRDPLPQSYRDAFAAITSDPRQTLIVGENAGAIVACLQLTFIPGLSHKGAWRAQIESVRVSAAHRNRGIGDTLIRYALDLARRQGCRTAQLTTDKTRADAHRFYSRLGFVTSHEGMKLKL